MPKPLLLFLLLLLPQRSLQRTRPTLPHWLRRRRARALEC
jgi:hypothetical protein